MKPRLPSKNVCERFHLTYELQGAQRGANVLTRYYRVRKMKVVVDGRRVSKHYSAEYFRNRRPNAPTSDAGINGSKGHFSY